MKKNGVILLLILLCYACKEDSRPKPKAFLALEYPEAEYSSIDLNCPYSFEKNDLADLRWSQNNRPCWINLHYPLLNGSIYITYQEVKNNLDSLLRDAQKLPLQHTIKADAIEGDLYTNDVNNTYGMMYEIEGNAASQVQFYVTDSTDNFITGSVYFNRQPNFDSIMPAAAYLKEDVRHIMESLRWKEE